MSNEPANHSQRNWLERFTELLWGEPKTQEELVELLHNAEQRHVIDPDALEMIEGVLRISNIQVRDIMIPRPQITTIDYNATLEEILPIVIESGHSRFPVLGDNRDEVIGILLAKDLLVYTSTSDAQPQLNIREILRPAVFIPESKRLNILLKEFRQNRNHMAIVVDEYGGVAGLITIEDVLEEIVGDIEDEHDVEEELNIRKLNEQRYLINALTPIEEFNNYFATNFSDEEFDTIGGLVLQNFGYLPAVGEKTQIEEHQFTVLEADSRRIHLLELEI